MSATELLMSLRCSTLYSEGLYTYLNNQKTSFQLTAHL